MRSLHNASLVIFAGLLLQPLIATAADTGPTPYPDAKNEAAWPGEGPIRLFGWMIDNRNYFWSQRERDQGAVVFVGDSLTGNWNHDLMAKLFPKLKVANRGIGGDVSRGLLFRFREDVLDLKPKAIVLCIGSNDLSAHADPALIEQNIAAILAQARAADANLPIVLCEIPPRNIASAPTVPGAHADLNQRIRKLAEGKEHLALLDLFTPLATPDGLPIDKYFQADHIHFADPGYEKWAELVTPVLEKLVIK